jgi:hypothetical protein
MYSSLPFRRSCFATPEQIRWMTGYKLLGSVETKGLPRYDIKFFDLTSQPVPSIIRGQHEKRHSPRLLLSANAHRGERSALTT